MNLFVSNRRASYRYVTRKSLFKNTFRIPALFLFVLKNYFRLKNFDYLKFISTIRACFISKMVLSGYNFKIAFVQKK